MKRNLYLVGMVPALAICGYGTYRVVTTYLSSVRTDVLGECLILVGAGAFLAAFLPFVRERVLRAGPAVPAVRYTTKMRIASMGSILAVALLCGFFFNVGQAIVAFGVVAPLGLAAVIVLNLLMVLQARRQNSA